MSSQQPSQQRMSREQRRAQLISVATEVFAENGYAQTTMDGIALKASVSKPVLYQHFENKRDLFFTLIDLQLNSLRDSVVTRMQSVDAASEDADVDTAFQAVYGVFEFVAHPKGLHRLIFDSSVDQSENLEQRKEQFFSDVVEVISPYLLDNSILEPVSSKYITRGIASSVLFLATRWAEHHADPENAAEHIPLEVAVQHTVRFVAYGAIGFDLSNNPTA